MHNIYIHIKCWNKWRKRNLNNWVHKFLVLINFRISPTLEIDKLFYGVADEVSDFSKNIEHGVKNMSKLVKQLKGDKDGK